VNKPQYDPDRVAAFHEAGHALIADEIGVRVARLFLVHDDGGCVPDPGDLATALFEDRLDFLVAGLIAGRVASPHLLPDEGTIDIQQIQAAFAASPYAYCSPELAAKMRQQAGERVSAILDRRSAALQALAEALLWHRELGQERIAEILNC
jgi:hypothetical protein